MSAPRKAIASFRTKIPDKCKYKAYLRVEFENTLMYYHFYDKDGYVEVKKPRVYNLDNEIEDAVIYKFVKKSVQEDEYFAERLEQKIYSIISNLSKKFGVKFEIINE